MAGNVDRVAQGTMNAWSKISLETHPRSYQRPRLTTHCLPLLGFIACHPFTSVFLSHSTSASLLSKQSDMCVKKKKNQTCSFLGCSL